MSESDVICKGQVRQRPSAASLKRGRGLNEFMLLLSSTLVGGGELGETLLIQVEIGSQVALFFLEGG